jgi:biopolymer transport protein ExbD
MRMRRAMAGHGSDETGIDLAPMLDFVLNLLIFFIITAVFAKEVGLTVSRPNSSAATEKKESGSIIITINAAGDIVVDKKTTDVRSVRAAIERLHAQRPDDSVVVVAEKGSQTGLLVQVIDQVRQGGIQAVSIAPAERA